jgi:O-antigen/teichoic acid export membrane protein
MESTPAAEQDVLDAAEAGGRAIRGGAIRSFGYFVGLALALVSAPLLTRHLGVVDFGRWVVVGSLITIVTIVADAGLTTVGVREYAVRDASGRHRLMRNLVAVRLVVALVGAIGAVVFAVAAGYEGVLVAGTALGGLGLLFTMAQHTYVIPLTAELRLGLATLLDLLRQALTVAGIVALVIGGAGLLAFFVLPVPIGIAVLATTLLTVRGHRGIRPRVDREEWRYLLAETLPAAAASVLASLFYRVAIVMMSVITVAAETGYFSASFRVVEAFVAVPSFVVGSAYPVLSRAADTDRQRLSYGFQRLFEVCVILGAWTAFALVAGADPIIAFIGGGQFDPAVPVLQIQGPALAATFLVALFGGTLWVVRAKRELVIGNLAGVAAAIALTGVLVPLAEAKGAAAAMVCAEGLLAAWLGFALLRSRPDLRPSLAVVPKVLASLAAAAAVALAPLPEIAVVLIGSAVYFGVLFLLRGIPVEIFDAVLRRGGDGADVLAPPSR